ncbi:MAG: DUF4423 domain-containing protein [Proteobacteria bacterium]|nr:DUF4423 domain-containing protein [Pseudomonadota bacterium]
MLKLSDKDRELLACTNFSEILRLELEQRCARNKSYSQRAFARDMNMAGSSISSITRGLQRPSMKAIQKIATRLQRPEPVCDYFMHLAFAQTKTSKFPHEDLAKAQAIRLRYMYAPLEANHRMIEQWDLSTFTLALLLRIKGELRTDEALCQRLGLTVEKLQSIISDLEKIGWIEPSADGPVSRVRYLEMGDQGSAYQIRAIHRRTLNQALASIEGLPYESRYFFNSYFTMNPDQFQRVCEKMREFALSVGNEHSPAGSDHQVYALGTFFLPLTSKK